MSNLFNKIIVVNVKILLNHQSSSENSFRKLILKQFLTSVCLGSEDPLRPDESHWILSLTKMFICKILQPTSQVAGWKLLDFLLACMSRL